MLDTPDKYLEALSVRAETLFLTSPSMLQPLRLVYPNSQDYL